MLPRQEGCFAMFKAWNVGRVHGIDVFLHPSLLLLLPIGLSDGLQSLVMLVAVFGCVFLHELGHAAMASAYGIRTGAITLYPIGGVAALDRLPRSAGPELLIAAAGPAVNFALAALLGLMLAVGWVGFHAAPDRFLLMLLAANLQLGLFNLLPIFPMDGGRILRALLSSFVGRVKATVVAAGLGQVLALVGAGVFLMQGMFLPAALCGFVFLAAGLERADVLRDEHRRRQAEWARAAGPGRGWFAGGWRPQPQPIRVRVVDPRRPAPWN